MTASKREAAGEWIRRCREEAGLSPAALAEQIGVTNKAVYAYEAGRSGVAEARVPALARALRRGVLETRRALGFYVHDGAVEEPPLPPPSVVGAILADTTLLPEAKENLMQLYALLQRIERPAVTDEERAEADLRAAAHAEELSGSREDRRPN